MATSSPPIPEVPAIHAARRAYDVGGRTYVVPPAVSLPTPVPYDPAQLDRVFRAARHVAGTLDRLGLVYFAIGGTLLGAVRHGSPVPWDLDVDLAIPSATYAALIPMLTELGRGTPYEWVDVRCPAVKVYAGGRCVVDLFAVDALPGSGELAFAAPYDGPGATRPTFDCHRELFPKLSIAPGDVYPTRRVPFGPGLTLAAPRRPEAWLFRNYSPSCLAVAVGPSATHAGTIHDGAHERHALAAVAVALFDHRSSFPGLYRRWMRFMGAVFRDGFAAYGGLGDGNSGPGPSVAFGELAALAAALGPHLGTLLGDTTWPEKGVLLAQMVDMLTQS